MSVQVDPGKPDLPISHPVTYSIYLSKLFGPYATLGLAEDTWALNEEVLDDDAFELGQQLLASLRAGWLEALRTEVGVERKLAP